MNRAGVSPLPWRYPSILHTSPRHVIRSHEGPHFFICLATTEVNEGLLRRGTSGKGELYDVQWREDGKTQTSSPLEGKLRVCHRTAKADVSACSSVV